SWSTGIRASSAASACSSRATIRGRTSPTTRSSCSTSSASARMARTSSEVNMKRLLPVLLMFMASPVFALNIFACEPEWAALAQELGGDKVSAVSATTARQDPHRIEARPSLIARIRDADLVICSGSELEVGWLPLLLTQSGNARIQPGSPGYL